MHSFGARAHVSSQHARCHIHSHNLTSLRARLTAVGNSSLLVHTPRFHSPPRAPARSGSVVGHPSIHPFGSTWIRCTTDFSSPSSRRL